MFCLGKTHIERLARQPEGAIDDRSRRHLAHCDKCAGRLAAARADERLVDDLRELQDRRRTGAEAETD